MNIRYRRYMNANNSKTCLPSQYRIFTAALRFIPSRKIAHHVWARPFIVFSLPMLSCY
jgi:hypothetical protein